MYELKCPSCGEVVKSPFVRAGAVVDCAGCGHRYRVDESHVTGRFAPASSGTAAAQPALVVETNEAGSRVHLDEAGNVVGLSGLSEMMKPEPAPAGRDNDQPLAGRPARPRNAGVPPHPASRPRPARGGGAQSTYIVAGLVALGALTIVGLALLYLLSAAGERDEPAIHGADLPTASAMRLAQADWDRPGAPFQRQDDAGPEVASVTDTSVRLSDDRALVTASIVSDHPGVIARARVHLSLVDQAGVEVARTQSEVGLVGRAHRQRLRLPIPIDLVDRQLTDRSRVEPMDVLEQGMFLDGATAAARGQAGETVVRVSVQNTTDRPLRRLVFLLTGLDGQGDPLTQWYVDWPEPLAAGKALRFDVAAPIDAELPVRRWRVEAAGEPGR